MSEVAKRARVTAAVGVVVHVIGLGLYIAAVAIAGYRDGQARPDAADYEGGEANVTFVTNQTLDGLERATVTAGAEAWASVLMFLATLLVSHAVWVMKKLYANERSALPAVGFYAWFAALVFAMIGVFNRQGPLINLHNALKRLPELNHSWPEVLHDRVNALGGAATVSLGGGTMLYTAVEFVCMAIFMITFAMLAICGKGPRSEKMSKPFGILTAILAGFAIILVVSILLTLSADTREVAIGAGGTWAIAILIDIILSIIWMIVLAVEIGKKQLPGKFSLAAAGLTAGDDHRAEMDSRSADLSD